MPNNFFEILNQIGINVALGGNLTIGNLRTIGRSLEIESIRSELLPGEKTITGTSKSRKEEIFKITETLWGLSAKDWLTIENGWLKEANKELGKTSSIGKTSIYDVISAELLVRLIAAIRIVSSEEMYKDAILEAEKSINLVLHEACSKGRTRMMITHDNQSVYSIHKKLGLVAGSGGSKYLPYPERSLPQLLVMLKRDSLKQKAYID